MSLFIISSQNNKIEKSFPEDDGFLHYFLEKGGRETPLCTCMSGSMTVEAAVILPVMACFFVFVLFYFQIMQIYISVQNVLEQAGGRMAVLAESEIEGEVKSNIEYLTLAKGQLYLDLKENELIEKYVIGGVMGISLITSEFQGDYILLKANYRIHVPVKLFGNLNFFMNQKTRIRKWTGWHSLEKESRQVVVYLTKYGEVYHLRKSCSYLDLSVQQISQEQLLLQRNAGGEKYEKCRLCEKREHSQEKVYITDYGDKYHVSVDCSGLKRIVSQKRLSELGGMSGCRKCSK